MTELTMYDVYTAMAVSVIVGGVLGWIVGKYGHSIWNAVGPGIVLIGLAVAILLVLCANGLILVLKH